MENNYTNKQLYSKILKERAEKLKKEFELPEGEHSLDPFLNKISGVESSFGKDTEHKPMNAGIHKGDAAKGRFGIMPNTAVDISKKLGNKATELGRYTQEVDLPKIKQLKDLPKEELEVQLADPEIEKKLARLLAKEAELKQKGEEDRMSYVWNQGTNIPYESITNEDLLKSEYVNKFKKIKDLLKKE